MGSVFYKRIIRQQISELSRLDDETVCRDNYLRLDKNERLFSFPDQIIKEIQKKITFNALSAYYDLSVLYQKLSKYLNVVDKQILITAGSDLAIKSVYEACVNINDSIVLHVPCYGMYRVYSKMFGAIERLVPLKNDWTIDVDKILKSVDETTKIVVIENPNGFVGTKPSIENINIIAKELHAKNTILLLDEAYNYIENDKVESKILIESYPNVLITQSFSKGHGLAGARVGCLIGDLTFMEYISRVRPMHEISSLSAIAAESIIDNPDLVISFQQAIKESKSYLFHELNKLDIPYRNTHGNFILLYLPDSGKSHLLTKKLKDQRVLIRRPFEENELEGWARVCVGDMKHAKEFIVKLKREYK